MSIINFAKSLMLNISVEPILTGPQKFDLVNCKTPSIHSSIYKKALVCFPLPQTSIDVLSLALATLRHNAAGAFSLPPCHAPSGPKIL